MPRIDLYLENLDRHQAEAMVLASDQPIQLELDGETRRLRKTCTADEIMVLVDEVMDAGNKHQLVVDSRTRFAYRSDAAGPVSIQIERRGGGLRCEISRAPGARERVEG